jgi:hypothetical protein
LGEDYTQYCAEIRLAALFCIVIKEFS